MPQIVIKTDRKGEQMVIRLTAERVLHEQHCLSPTLFGDNSETHQYYFYLFQANTTLSICQL